MPGWRGIVAVMVPIVAVAAGIWAVMSIEAVVPARVRDGMHIGVYVLLLTIAIAPLGRRLTAWARQRTQWISDGDKPQDHRTDDHTR